MCLTLFVDSRHIFKELPQCETSNLMGISRVNVYYIIYFKSLSSIITENSLVKGQFNVAHASNFVSLIFKLCNAK